MKISALVILLTALFMAVCAVPFRDRVTLPRPRPGNPGFPNFPGQGPFNPKPWGRQRRSPNGKITVDQPINGRPSVAVDAEHNVYEGRYGSVKVYGGGKVEQSGRPEAQAGVRGEFHWGSNGYPTNAAREAAIDRMRKQQKID